jgi:hypothetical protein
MVLADAKFEIEQILTRYCVAVDRCDLEMLKSVFWPDATTDYGMGLFNAHIMAEGLIPSLMDMEMTHHSVSNFLIHFDQDVLAAKVQTYCTAFHLIEADGQRLEMEVGGRYLDQLEKRDGSWRIASRLYVMDWNRNGPSTAQWNDGLYRQLANRGTRAPEDPYYAFIK